MRVGVGALPIVVLGSRTCEDTAVTRSRLRALGVPFDDIDIDADPSAAARVVGLNDGRRITPTVVFGRDEIVVAEPTLERLGELLTAAGHAYARPAAAEFHGDRASRPIPFRRVRALDGTPFTLSSLRGRRQVALFLGHGPDCLVCFGYARQLALQEPALAEADGTALIVVPGPADATAAWREGIAPSTPILADPEAAWKGAIAVSLGRSPDEAMLLLLDRFLAPRAGSFGAEAGALIDPSEASRWLDFIALDCPECAGEVAWSVGEA